MTWLSSCCRSCSAAATSKPRKGSARFLFASVLYPAEEVKKKEGCLRAQAVRMDDMRSDNAILTRRGEEKSAGMRRRAVWAEKEKTRDGQDTTLAWGEAFSTRKEQTSLVTLCSVLVRAQA